MQTDRPTHTHRQTDRQADRRTDRQTHRRTDRLAGRQTDRIPQLCQLFNVSCDYSFVSLANRKRRSTRGTPKEPSGTRRNPTDVLVRAALAQGSTLTRLCVAIVLLHRPASIGNVPFVEAGVARIGCSASFGAASPAAPVHLGTADVAPKASGVTACVCWAASCVPPRPSLVHG